MTTISFSVEDSIKQDIDRFARVAKKSKSDVFRDMVVTYKFNTDLEAFQKRSEAVLKQLGIRDEQELYDYLESDETYEDRIRHQRLLGSRKRK
jgi:hypothetical protein